MKIICKSREKGDINLKIKTRAESKEQARVLAKNIGAAIHREGNRTGIKMGFKITVEVI